MTTLYHVCTVHLCIVLYLHIYIYIHIHIYIYMYAYTCKRYTSPIISLCVKYAWSIARSLRRAAHAVEGHAGSYQAAVDAWFIGIPVDYDHPKYVKGTRSMYSPLYPHSIIPMIFPCYSPTPNMIISNMLNCTTLYIYIYTYIHIYIYIYIFGITIIQ